MCSLWATGWQEADRKGGMGGFDHGKTDGEKQIPRQPAGMIQSLLVEGEGG